MAIQAKDVKTWADWQQWRAEHGNNEEVAQSSFMLGLIAASIPRDAAISQIRGIREGAGLPYTEEMFDSSLADFGLENSPYKKPDTTSSQTGSTGAINNTGNDPNAIMGGVGPVNTGASNTATNTNTNTGGTTNTNTGGTTNTNTGGTTNTNTGGTTNTNTGGTTNTNTTNTGGTTNTNTTNTGAGHNVTIDAGSQPTIGAVTNMTASQTTIDQANLGKASVAGEAQTAGLTQVGAAEQVAAPETIQNQTVTAANSRTGIENAQSTQSAVTGTVDNQALVNAAQGRVSSGALATAQTVDDQYVQQVTGGTRRTQAGELITAVGQDAVAPQADVEQARTPARVTAATGQVQQNQLVNAAQIRESDIAQARAITSSGLNADSKVVAARLSKFTVDAGTLAKAAQGNVDAQATVQGQLTELMQSFDDGATPAWASGAIRAANAAMAARGLGGSSMAAVAVFNAAMESALPIAAQDAQTFAQMGLANLNNRQQTALANAAAQQGLALQNLSNEQQARITNAANSFALQSQNLSNMQQTMLANTQIRAALQGQNLTNRQQAAVVNAARYAEQANINLNNIQQAALHNSSMAVQVDVANLSARQQTAIANAQLQAALQGKVLDLKQQAAVFNADRIAQNANMTFTAQQTAALHNSELMKSIGIANLNASQATVIANAATIASMDLANLNNRQQAAVLNAKAFLDMDLANLNNEQQMAVLKSQQIAQAILADTAAENAARLTNATNAIEVDRINTTLKLTADQFNTTERNKISMANADAANTLARFNATEANDRSEFNARMSTEVSVANARILADVSTANTAAVNAAAALNAKNAVDMTTTQYTQQMTLYRDLLSMSWSSGEKFDDRVNNLAIAALNRLSAAETASITADSTASARLGSGLIALALALAD